MLGGNSDRYIISGVSECIIMGIPMTVGTGLFQLLHKYPLLSDNSFSNILFPDALGWGSPGSS